jgi:hypothetical protein
MVASFWLDNSSERRRRRKDAEGFVGFYWDRNGKTRMNGESCRTFMIVMAIEPDFENEGVGCRDSGAIES